MQLIGEDIVKTYGGQSVLRGVSISLGTGESLALTGESGSGKSTLIHILAGLDTPDAGSVTFDEREIGSMTEPERAMLRRNNFGIVFQQFNLIPSMTARENLRFQADLAGRYDRAFCDELANALSIAEHLGKYPEELSGGQQQRIAIGRALASRPQIILADEPTGNLDEQTADATLDLLLRLVRDTETGLIMATHSPSRAARLDRHVHLSRGTLSCGTLS